MTLKGNPKLTAPIHKGADIADILNYWDGHDDVPEELWGFLAIAADEIRGMRAEIEDLKRQLEDMDLNPRF